MREEEILPKIKDRVSSELAGMGLELIEATYVRGLLRLTIDKPEGVTLNDCTAASRRVGLLLDAEDPIPHRYRLEVTSPGLNRKLTKPDDFIRFAGKAVKLTAADKTYKGILKGMDGDDVLIDENGEKVSIDIRGIKKANLDFDF